MTAEDQALINDVLAEVACWDDANLVAAAVAVVHHRFADGHGTTDRPLPDRCLAGWLAVEHTTAQRRLKGLIERGLLELVVSHDRYAARTKRTATACGGHRSSTARICAMTSHAPVSNPPSQGSSGSIGPTRVGKAEI